MEITKKYVVFQLNSLLENDGHKSLKKLQFNGFKSNSFDSEEEAIQALIDDEKTYYKYFILTQIIVRG